MVKVGLLTIFHAYNYGAVLQAYATYESIENLGARCELINYDCTTMKRDRQLFVLPDSLSSLLRNIRTLFHLKEIESRNQKYEKFIRKMSISDRRWFNNYDFTDAQYDVIMTGSDQTFCLHLRNNPSEMKAYFLPICGDQRRVSYAPSMGEKVCENTKEEIEWMRNRFLMYDKLSVRDQKSADFIESLIGVRPNVVLDPTLLLNSEQWDKLITDEEAVESGRYIFFYTVLSEQWVVDYAINIAKKLKMKLIAVHGQNRYEIGKGIERILDCSPQHFLNLIKNAEYVITTSFHATAFSVIYNKPLISIALGEGNRITSLLDQLNMNSAIVTESTYKSKDVFYTNYSVANDKLNELRSNSLKYLANIISLEK